MTGLPGKCRGCGVRITYANGRWRDNYNGAGHDCPMKRRPTCGALMPLAGESCARRPGHRSGHKTRYALDNQVAKAS